MKLILKFLVLFINTKNTNHEKCGKTHFYFSFGVENGKALLSFGKQLGTHAGKIMKKTKLKAMNDVGSHGSSVHTVHTPHPILY